MLVLSRKVGESIWIGEDIEIRVEDIDRNRVRVSLLAPREVLIERAELRAKRLATERQRAGLPNVCDGAATPTAPAPA